MQIDDSLKIDTAQINRYGLHHSIELMLKTIDMNFHTRGRLINDLNEVVDMYMKDQSGSILVNDTSEEPK